MWNFGRADWEDEEKLIKMEQEEVEHESAFQGTGEDVVYASNNGLQDRFVQHDSFTVYCTEICWLHLDVASTSNGSGAYKQTIIKKLDIAV